MPKAKTENQAYSHWTGYQAEIRLANEVAGMGQTVIKWGDSIGRSGSDIISVNQKTGEVSLWDSKYRSTSTLIDQSPTYEKSNTRQNAVTEAVDAITRSNLSIELQDKALQNLRNGNYVTNTVGAGQVKNSVQVRYCGNRPC